METRKKKVLLIISCGALCVAAGASEGRRTPSQS